MTRATREQMAALLQDRKRVLRVIGVYAVAAASRAFREQRSPDGTPWPQRYPNQAGDPLNVAGAIEDLGTGARIKKRRYDVRPAGVDSGTLRGRLTFEATDDELRVGSDVPYARRFQEGGKSRQRLDTAVLRNLMEFLRGRRRAVRRSAGRAARLAGYRVRGARIPVPRTVEERRLGPVFAAARNTGYWETESPARPFVGLSQRDAADIAEQIEADARRIRVPRGRS